MRRIFLSLTKSAMHQVSESTRQSANAPVGVVEMILTRESNLEFSPVSQS